MKRVADMLLASLGLLVLSPFILLAAILIKVDSSGPAIFSQTRIGRHFKPFQIYKLRTMKNARSGVGRQITVGQDERITRVGRFLRKTKMDEIPQLFNVLKGEMSLVGPRPELPQYVNMFAADYSEILEVRPGITDLASIEYRNESDLLARYSDPEQAYVTEVLPEKLRYAKQYVRESSLWLDLWIIIKTLRAVV